MSRIVKSLFVYNIAEGSVTTTRGIKKNIFQKMRHIAYDLPDKLSANLKNILGSSFPSSTPFSTSDSLGIVVSSGQVISIMSEKVTT